jgi:hypothetical protein
MEQKKTTHIPRLEPQRSGSWVLTRKATGEVIGEIFKPCELLFFNPHKVLIETTLMYLSRINQEIKKGGLRDG